MLGELQRLLGDATLLGGRVAVALGGDPDRQLPSEVPVDRPGRRSHRPTEQALHLPEHVAAAELLEHLTELVGQPLEGVLWGVAHGVGHPSSCRSVNPARRGARALSLVGSPGGRRGPRAPGRAPDGGPVRPAPGAR